ncbi:MAG: hypothetical protein KJ949_01615 [Nanoarchaeota archaeon]|nr:hypothetical protein [Nanoarchaeota archaeon]MBU4308347.1 hypothetical protein [Nanoarchaeota archaeon]
MVNNLVDINGKEMVTANYRCNHTGEPYQAIILEEKIRFYNKVGCFVMVLQPEIFCKQLIFKKPLSFEDEEIAKKLESSL